MRKKKTETYAKELAFAKKLALSAGKIMLKYFDGDHASQKLEKKKNNSPVTIADKLVNDLVIREISKKFPDDGIVGEERSTSEYGAGRKWICDPIDGTKAFVWGTPTAMFSLALVVDGVPVLGVAHDPFLERTYYAVKGRGSYCNSKRLHVSNQGLDQGFVAVTSNPLRACDLPYIPKIVEAGAYLSVFSGAVYKACLVARGKFVAFVERGVNPYDIAAVHVIVEEAGGIVRGFDGRKLDYSKPFRGTIISNKASFNRLLSVVRASGPHAGA